ncbi:MAG: amidohydrolase [Bacteroidetes bacterium]|nr:amidohydrolase [Bacteroidota bacterium]
MTVKFRDKLVALRKELHRNPELSGQEKRTAARIKSFIGKLKPDRVIKDIGGYGLAFIFNGEENGPTVLIRCELDALPIVEINDFDYRSVEEGKAHKCGHDGHMVILAGLAKKLADKRPIKGRVVLLYQPAEETGQGAKWVLNDPKFDEIKPDYVFALHNIPGYPRNAILCRKGPFAVASAGITIKLFGKTSHAGEPEKGINPASAIADLIKGITVLPEDEGDFKDFVLTTIVHIKLGAIAFGTSAGYAELRATLRARYDEDIELLKAKTISLLENICKRESLKFDHEFEEDFPAVNNHEESTQLIHKAADENNFKCIELEQPFPWSEDFSNFINASKGAMFGLGSGVHTPQLHNPDYDFPDDITETGISMFYAIIQKILN